MSFDTHQLGGGSFDPATMRLYITIQQADRLQGTYANPPVVAVYRFPAFENAPAAFAAGFGSDYGVTFAGDLDADGDVDGHDLGLMANRL